MYTKQTKTTRDIIAMRESIRFDLAVQREEPAKWKKPESAYNLWDSMATEQFPIMPVNAIDDGKYFWILDGNNRIRVALRIYDGETKVGELVWENLPKEDKDKFLNYEWDFYLHDIETMTPQKQAKFFSRCNSSGAPLSKTQAERGNYIAKLGKLFDSVKELETIKAMELNRSGIESMTLQTLALLSGQKDTLSPSILLSAQSCNENDIARTNSCIIALDGMAKLAGEDNEEKRIVARYMKKSHLPVIAFTLGMAIAKDKEFDLDKAYNRMYRFFETDREERTPERETYSNLIGSGSSNAENIAKRIEIIRNVLTTAISQKVKSNDKKLEDDKKHAQEEQAKADAKNSLELARQKAIDNAITAGKQGQPKNNFKRK